MKSGKTLNKGISNESVRDKEPKGSYIKLTVNDGIKVSIYTYKWTLGRDENYEIYQMSKEYGINCLSREELKFIFIHTRKVRQLAV